MSIVSSEKKNFDHFEVLNTEEQKKEIPLEEVAEIETITEDSGVQESQNDLKIIKDMLGNIFSRLDNEAEGDSVKDDVAPSLKEMMTLQEELKREFQAKLKYDQYKEKIIDDLHKEVQDYKEDIVKKIIQPLVRDLIMVNANIYKLVENYRAQDQELDADKILKTLESVTMDIDDALYRQGIEPLESPNEHVEPLKQKILKTIKVADQSKERQIAKRIRKGYEWDDKIIQKEEVYVYVYDKSLDDDKKQLEKEGEDKNE